MTSLHALRGWRFDPGRVALADVVAPSADTLDPAARDALYARHERNVIRLIAGRPSQQDTAWHNPWTRAAAHLDAWREEGLFLQDRPSVYVVERQSGKTGAAAARRSFVCRALLPPEQEPESETLAAPVGDADASDQTRRPVAPDPDALARLRALRGHICPLAASLADPDGTIADALASIADYDPLAALPGPRHGTHRIWVVDHAERVDGFLALASGQAFSFAEDMARVAACRAYAQEVRDAVAAAGRPVPAWGDFSSDYVFVRVDPETTAGGAPDTDGQAAAADAPPLPCGLVLDLHW